MSPVPLIFVFVVVLLLVVLFVRLFLIVYQVLVALRLIFSLSELIGVLIEYVMMS